MSLSVRKGILVILFRDEEHMARVKAQAWIGDPEDDFEDFSVESFLEISRNTVPTWMDSCELEDLDKMLDRMVQKLVNPEWGPLTKTEDVRLVSVAFHQIFVGADKIFQRFVQTYRQAMHNAYIRLFMKELQGEMNYILDRAAKTGYFPEMGSGVTPNLYFKPLILKLMGQEKPHEWLVSGFDDDPTDSALS